MVTVLADYKHDALMTRLSSVALPFKSFNDMNLPNVHQRRKNGEILTV